MYPQGRSQPYDLDGSGNRGMMGMGPMQGMTQDTAYHQQRASMMMGQPAGYGHLQGNHPYSTPTYNRGYPRAAVPQGMHPSAGMGGVISKQVPMTLQQGVNHSYMTASNPALGNASYMSYAPHPHQLNQAPQTLQMASQGMGNMNMGQSQMIQGYHGSHQGMGAVPASSPYVMRGSMYPQNQGMVVNPSMGYATHQQQHRLPMAPSLSHIGARPSMDGRMPIGSQLQSIKIENQQQMIPNNTLPSSANMTMGMSHDTHQPHSNTPIYPQYAALPPTPAPVPEDSDFIKKSKEIAAVFETYRANSKDADSELAKKINRYLPLLKSKDGIHDILQECEQICKEIQAHDLSQIEQTSILNTNSINYFSDNKFPDNRLPPEFTLDIPANRTEHFLNFEIDRLDPRLFSVDRVPTSNSTCFSLRLECYLKREGLPILPPLLVKIPADYPNSSPETDLTELYSSTPFLRQVKKCFTEEMVSIAGEYTLSHLLSCWERVVKNICVTM